MRVVISEAKVDYLVKDAPLIRTPENAVEQGDVIRHSDTEAFVVLTLDAKRRLRSADIVTNGILDASLAEPREVFRIAIAKNAGAVVLMHNHPSGDVTPSSSDILTTKRLIEAGNIIGISVLDHIILGNEKHLSMREEGICKF